MLEIPNDQFQLEPIYKTNSCWNLGESTRKSTWACCVPLKESEKKKQNPNEDIKIPIEAKTSYGIYCWKLNLHILIYVNNVARMAFQTYQMYW